MADWKVAFSILNRIEWVVTSILHSTGNTYNGFQYPESDRMGCNLSGVMIWAWPRRLSVS